METGLISPGGENLLDFTELRQVLSTYDGTSWSRSGDLSKGQSPCELLEGVSLFLSRRCQGHDLVWSRGQNLKIPLQG